MHVAADIEGWDAIAEHRAGTAGDLATAHWLADTVRAAGVEPRLDMFPFRRRVLGECAVEVDGRRAEGVPLFDGGLTDEAGVTCPLTRLGGAGQGIAVTTSSPGGTSTALSTARNSTYRAVVAGSEPPEGVPGFTLLNAPAYGRPFGPPVLQVATDEVEWLDAAAEAGAVARLVAHATIEDTEACNVLTRIPGRNPQAPPLVIMTPRSSWWTSTAERGGGIAVWLACIRHFANKPGRCDVLFTANTGHELGHVGLEYYMARHPRLAKGACAWIHLGANFAAADCHHAGRRLAAGVRYQASPDLFAMGLETLEAFGILPDTIVPTDVRPGGEAQNVFDAGGSYVSLLGKNPWFHHPDDRWPNTVDLEKTETICRAVLHIARTLADA
ncbi:MAG: hypothetical protein OXH52_01140 [Gammaproteobacteria bacterium]|nr:hypothetical protein [Gammaproteobacteria bacterium]